MVVQYEKKCTPYKMLELCRCTFIEFLPPTHPSKPLAPIPENETPRKSSSKRTSSRSVGTSATLSKDHHRPLVPYPDYTPSPHSLSQSEGIYSTFDSNITLHYKQHGSYSESNPRDLSDPGPVSSSEGLYQTFHACKSARLVAHGHDCPCYGPNYYPDFSAAHHRYLDFNEKHPSEESFGPNNYEHLYQPNQSLHYCQSENSAPLLVGCRPYSEQYYNPRVEQELLMTTSDHGGYDPKVLLLHKGISRYRRLDGRSRSRQSTQAFPNSTPNLSGGSGGGPSSPTSGCIITNPSVVSHNGSYTNLPNSSVSQNYFPPATQIQSPHAQIPSGTSGHNLAADPTFGRSSPHYSRGQTTCLVTTLQSNFDTRQSNFTQGQPSSRYQQVPENQFVHTGMSHSSQNHYQKPASTGGFHSMVVGGREYWGSGSEEEGVVNCVRSLHPNPISPEEVMLFRQQNTSQYANFNPATLYPVPPRSKQFQGVETSFSPNRSKTSRTQPAHQQHQQLQQQHPSVSFQPTVNSSSSLYWARTTPCLETVDEHRPNSSSHLRSDHTYDSNFAVSERQSQPSQLVVSGNSFVAAPYGRSRRSNTFHHPSRPPSGQQQTRTQNQYSPPGVECVSAHSPTHPQGGGKEGILKKRGGGFDPQKLTYITSQTGNNSSNNKLKNSNAGPYDLNGNWEPALSTTPSSSNSINTITPLSDYSPPLQSLNRVSSPHVPNYNQTVLSSNDSRPHLIDHAAPIWQLRSRDLQLESSSEGLCSDSATDRLQSKVNAAWFQSSLDDIADKRDNKTIKSPRLRNGDSQQINQLNQSSSPKQVSLYDNVNYLVKRSNTELFHDRSTSFSPSPKTSPQLHHQQTDPKFQNSRQLSSEITSLNGSVEDIWVKKPAGGNHSAGQSSSSISNSAVSSNANSSENMAPQRSYKLIDPCLHSSNPQNPTYKTSDMKQSRTSVSIQSDSYNFGGPIRKQSGGMCATQSISSLDSFQDDLNGSGLLPLGELCDSFANGVENIVTSYEKLDVEEKTGTMNKVFKSWSGDKNRICMKPPPFKAAVASLYSLRTRSNNNSFSDWSVNRVGMNNFRATSVKSHIDQTVSVPSTPVQKNYHHHRQSISSSRQNNHERIFSTQSEMNVANVSSSVESHETPNHTLLKNYRSELILAQTLSSVDSLALKQRSKSQVTSRDAPRTNRAKSSSDLSSSGALTISDDFRKSFSSTRRSNLNTEVSVSKNSTIVGSHKTNTANERNEWKKSSEASESSIEASFDGGANDGTNYQKNRQGNRSQMGNGKIIQQQSSFLERAMMEQCERNLHMNGVDVVNHTAPAQQNSRHFAPLTNNVEAKKSGITISNGNGTYENVLREQLVDEFLDSEGSGRNRREGHTNGGDGASKAAADEVDGIILVELNSENTANSGAGGISELVTFEHVAPSAIDSTPPSSVTSGLSSQHLIEEASVTHIDSSGQSERLSSPSKEQKNLISIESDLPLPLTLRASKLHANSDSFHCASEKGVESANQLPTENPVYSLKSELLNYQNLRKRFTELNQPEFDSSSRVVIKLANEKMINELTATREMTSEEAASSDGMQGVQLQSEEELMTQPEHYPEFTGAEDRRDLTTAFSEFASAISSLITIADSPNTIPPSSLTDLGSITSPRFNTPAVQARTRPKLPITTSTTEASTNSPLTNPYDVTPTNEISDDFESCGKSRVGSNSDTSNQATYFAGLYPELEMKVEQFINFSPPSKPIEVLLERLKKPQSLQVFLKVIGRSKSTPGSLNEVSNVGRLRPLRVPKDLKGACWNSRLKRSLNSVYGEGASEKSKSTTNMIPRRPKSKRNFMRDDLDRCKSVPLTKEEIQALSHESQTDGIASLPSVTNLHELGLYEYVDVNAELNISMQKMFTVSKSPERSTQNHTTHVMELNNHESELNKSESRSSFAGGTESTNHVETESDRIPVENQPITEMLSIKERLNSSAASTCANIDVSQLIMELCNEDAEEADFGYPDSDDEGGGIRDPEPSFDDDGIELKDEYFASELITENHFNNNNNIVDFNRGAISSLDSSIGNPGCKMGVPTISRNGFPTSHPPPVIPVLQSTRQIIERSVTFPRTLDEITECANE